MSKEFNKNQTNNYLPRLCRASSQDIKLVVLPKFPGDPSSPRVTCTGHVKHARKVTGFPTGRRQIHNSTHSNLKPTQTDPIKLNRSKSAAAAAATAAASVCGCRGGASGESAGDSQKDSQKIVSGKYSKYSVTTFDKSKTGSWIILNTTNSGKSNLNYSNLKRLLGGKNLIKPVQTNREVRLMRIKRRPVLESGLNYDVEQDPPLPVVKIIKNPGFDREEVNLWKRRSSKKGIELENLKIQKIDVGKNNYHTINNPTFFDDVLESK